MVTNEFNLRFVTVETEMKQNRQLIESLKFNSLYFLKKDKMSNVVDLNCF